MKKVWVFLCIIFLAPLIAGIYGVIHDQITYTLSEEYFTKFKFHQFGFIPWGEAAQLPYPRIQVSAIGFLATWWVGIPLGIILGLFGFTHQNKNRMLKVTLKAFLVTIFIAFLTGITGWFYGYFYLGLQPKTYFHLWFFPQENLYNFRAFVAVGSFHNFSYLGGLTGLIAGLIYSAKKQAKDKKIY